MAEIPKTGFLAARPKLCSDGNSAGNLNYIKAMFWRYGKNECKKLAGGLNNFYHIFGLTLLDFLRVLFFSGFYRPVVLGMEYLVV